MFLFGFYKAVGVLLIFKLKVNLLTALFSFLSGISIQKIKCKNMFLLGSYLVFCNAVGVLLIFKIKVNLLPGLTWFLSGIRIQKI